MTRLSVCITAFNSAETLADVLRSVRWADEIIVLDSGSSDATEAIARAAGVRWFTQPFAGYAAQKQKTIDLATGDWVLILDSDEVVSQPLAREIQTLLAGDPDRDGYDLPRRELVFWTLAHPSVRRNRFLRLARREAARMSDRAVHETVLVDGSVGSLGHELLHYGERSIAIKVDKINQYSTLGVDALKRSPKLRDLLIRPPWYFFRHYVLKRNCLTGLPGLVTSTIGAMQVFLKYAKAIEATHATTSSTTHEHRRAA